MMTGFIRDRDAGRRCQTGTSEITIKVDQGEASGFAIFVSDLPAHAPGPPAHVHEEFDEAWYVLSGEVQFEIDSERGRLHPGSLAFAPRGRAHRFSIAADAPARMLVVTTPEALP